MGFYFKKYGEWLPTGADSLRSQLEFERKLGLLVLVMAMAPESLRLLEFERKLGLLVISMALEGVSRLNDVSMTFMQIETIDGDLDALPDGPGTERSDPKAGEIVGDRDS